jgi:hypothetical protein
MNSTALCDVMLCCLVEQADISEWPAAFFSVRSTLMIARLMGKQFLYNLCTFLPEFTPNITEDGEMYYTKCTGFKIYPLPLHGAVLT